MKHLKACLAFAAAFSLISMVVPAKAEPLKNIVLVHGAWVDASGWKPVYDILTKEGFHVSMVQEPETSFADDVTAAKRIFSISRTAPRSSSGTAMAGRSSQKPAFIRRW